MLKIAFRPYAGDDREEKVESDHVQAALIAALSDRVEIVEKFPTDATHAFGRPPKNWMPPSGTAYPSPENMHIDYWTWDAFLASARRSVQVQDLDGAKARVAEIHASGRDAFVKATMPKFYASVVPRGETLTRHLDALVYSFIDRGPCLIVQERVDMIHEYRLFVVDGELVTGAGTVFSHTPDDNTAPFNPLVSDHPSNDDCVARPELVARYLDFARRVIPEMPIKTFSLDVALIDGEVGIVELNPLMLGQIGLFACDPTRLTAAVLRSCGLAA